MFCLFLFKFNLTLVSYNLTVLAWAYLDLDQQTLLRLVID